MLFFYEIWTKNLKKKINEIYQKHKVINIISIKFKRKIYSFL